MRILISGTDISPEVKQCNDRDEVACLYEEYVIGYPIGDETTEHRQQRNNELFDSMLKVFNDETTSDDLDYHYS